MSTPIQWTDETWNPIRGCSRVSEGCRNCYAEAIAARFSGPGLAYEGLARRRSNGEPQWTGEVRVIEKHMNDPLRWRTPKRIFVNSMSDLFHENVSDETIDRVFAVMALAPRHTFQVLTKRPERMRSYIADGGRLLERGLTRCVDRRTMIVNTITRDQLNGRLPGFGLAGAPWPLPNVWLGTSVENQTTADERIPLLSATPAAVRFLSAEPLLQGIDFGADRAGFSNRFNGTTGASGYISAAGPTGANHHPGRCVCQGDDPVPHKHYPDPPFSCARCGRDGCAGFTPNSPLSGIHWIIVGGESGPNARPFDVAWARSIVAQCRVAGVAPFVKQLGRDPVSREGTFTSIALKHSHGGDVDEWPEDLRVREFPAAAAR